MSYVDIEGARLWVNDGGGNGPPLVLLHAAAGHSGCWTEQTPLIAAAGYRVITYDLRGFGQTEAANSSEGSIAGDLEQLVAKLGIAPFYLVATAYGGFGGFEFALDNPEKLKAVVISTSFGGLTDPGFAAMRAANVDPNLMSRPTHERELGASYRAANPEGTQRFIEMEHNSYRGDGARQRLRTPTTLARLETMGVPALIIAGDEDSYAPPPVMQALAEHIPGSRFEVVKGAGHSAYWEQPEVWYRLIVEFLRQHP